MSGLATKIDLPKCTGSLASEATATCLCAAVRLSFPTEGPDLIDTFICHCSNCRKLSASLFGAGIMVSSRSVKHLRGQDNLTDFMTPGAVASGGAVTNTRCGTCGTLMYRISTSFPGVIALRTGTVDDASLFENKLRLKTEQFTMYRPSWLPACKDAKQAEGQAF
ncbi:Mss4-like protein [Xylariaceae sp. FL1651]|nr:Mss4-like protein [Xylariaceae sp. FL1651]